MVPFAPSNLQAEDFRAYRAESAYYPEAYDGYEASPFKPTGVGVPGLAFSPGGGGRGTNDYHPYLLPYNKSPEGLGGMPKPPLCPPSLFAGALSLIPIDPNKKASTSWQSNAACPFNQAGNGFLHSTGRAAE